MLDAKRSGRPKTATDEGNTINILAKVIASPKRSIRYVSRQSGVSKESVRRILKASHFRPYKMVHVHTMHDNDPLHRRQFCNWIINQMDNDNDFIKQVIFSDECLFYLDGHAHTQNARYWSRQNPAWIREVNDPGAPRVMVWCGLLGDTVLGPHFFEGNVNQHSYSEVLDSTLLDFLDDLPLNRRQKLWFQQDGATAHYALIVRNNLNRKFGYQWIGRGGPRTWPARSPDLTPLDFFLWGYVKQHVFQTQPASLEDLKDRINNVIRHISPHTLSNVSAEVRDRVRHCLQVDGRHFEHLR